MQDLYDVLGIPRNADLETIKYAFRRRAKIVHPDMGGNASDFEILVLAHRVLSDQRLRDQYDRTGRADINSGDVRQQQALSIVQNLIANALAKVMRIDTVNIVAVMKHDLMEAIQAGQSQLNTGKKKIERLEQVRDRMMCQKEPNRLRLLLEGQIRIEQATLERCREQIEIHELARELLTNYDYRVDQAASVYLSLGIGGFAQGTQGTPF